MDAGAGPQTWTYASGGSQSSPTSALEAGSRNMVESGVDKTQADSFCFSSSRAVPATHFSPSTASTQCLIDPPAVRQQRLQTGLRLTGILYLRALQTARGSNDARPWPQYGLLWSAGWSPWFALRIYMTYALDPRSAQCRVVNRERTTRSDCNRCGSGGDATSNLYAH